MIEIDGDDDYGRSVRSVVRWDAKVMEKGG